jgi:hypothetical protein
MAYFAVEVLASLTCGYIENTDELPVVGLGLAVDPDEIAVPVELTVRSKRPLQLEDFYPDKALMSARFLALLRAHGVQNVQVFPAVLTNSATGEKFTTWSVVNVIGEAQLEGTSVRPPADDPGARIFALGHSLAVEETLAKAIEAAGFPNLVLTPV